MKNILSTFRDTTKLITLYEKMEDHYITITWLSDKKTEKQVFGQGMKNTAITIYKLMIDESLTNIE